jgi:hypothetical protein
MAQGAGKMKHSDQSTDHDVAVKQYAILLPALLHEANGIWIRSGLFAAGNAALFAGTVQVYARPGQNAQLYFLAITGVVLCSCWWEIVHHGSVRQDHWEELLRRIEPHAFGDIPVIRNIRNDNRQKKTPRGRTICRALVLVFSVIWCVIAFVSYHSWMRMMIAVGTALIVPLCLRFSARHANYLPSK